MKQNFWGYTLVLLLAIFMSGCAIGNKYKIADVEPQLQVKGNASIAVASLDKRPSIQDHSSPVTYVGMVRGGYGNPFNATTQSDLPFADAVSKAICQSLERRGFKTTPVTVKFEMSKEDATQELLDKSKDKSILVVIKGWESDSFYNLNIGYDFVLKVFDKNGDIRATSEAKDKVAVSGSVMTGSLGLSKTEVPATFQKAIETLLNEPAVVHALAE